MLIKIRHLSLAALMAFFIVLPALSQPLPNMVDTINKLWKSNDSNVTQGRRVALVIGNADYKHTLNLPKLDNPSNDAEDISTALRLFGFEVIERKNQSLEEMNQVIAEFGRKIEKSNAAVFYFAGHGIQVKNQNYLMPTDAKIESEASVPYQGINVNQILDEMDNAKTPANIVILDACRNNPVAGGKFRSGKSRGLATPGNPPKGTVIVFATDPGNVAADGEGRNGLFTSGLLKAFKADDLSLDGVLTFASAEVERLSNNTQSPYVNGPKTLQKNFNFKITIEPGKQEIERTFWLSIERSNNISDFEAYLKKYPNGNYIQLANNHIERIKKSNSSEKSFGINSALKKYALVIGMGKYNNFPLFNSVNDAIAVHKTLSTLDFNVTGNIDGNKESLTKTLHIFSEKIKKENADVVVVYYAGHSFMANGDDHLIPIHTGNIKNEFDAIQNSISLSSIYKTLNLEKLPSNNIFIHDASRDNPFLKNGINSDQKTTLPLRGYDVPNTLFIFSAKPGYPAQDGDDGHGLLTGSLIQNFKTNKIGLKTVLKNAREDVFKKSKGMQEAVVNGDALSFPDLMF